MSSVNKVILVGYVGRQPEVKNTSSGDQVGLFSLATTEQWKDKATGEQKKSTQWHNIVIFNDRLVGLIGKFVTTGAKIYVEGQLQNRAYKTKNGTEHIITEVVLPKFRGEIVLLSSRHETQTDQSNLFSPQNGVDDEIPF